MNKKIVFLSLVALMLIGMVSCKKDEVEPTASFDFTTEKLVVTFVNKSSDANTYSWDFGDGTTSKDANPTHTYGQNGTYTVKLTASNDSGSDDVSKEILVNDGIDKTAQPGFNIEIDDLTVQFTNTSLNANTYSWDFGDGNTSTEKDPTHTYAKNGTYTVKLTATNDEGSKDLTKEVTVTSKYKQDGYYIGSLINSSAGRTYYGGYFEELSSDVDLVAKTSFQRIEIKQVRNGYMYGWPTDDSDGLAKMAVNAEGELEIVGLIPTTEFARGVVIINDQLGFFNYFYKDEIEVFNPSTMEIINTIKLTGATKPEGFETYGYSDMYYNPITNKLYLTLYVNSANPPTFYDLDKVIVEVVDVASQSWEKTIVQEDAMYPLLRGNQGSCYDSEGNTYLLCQGSYGLDGQIGPSAPKRSRPQILKINSNSEFETDYAFNPINKAGFENNFFQLATNLIVKDNKGYIIGTAQTDSPEIVALLQKYAAGTITQEETDQLYYLVLYDESMKLMEVDLQSKNVNTVDNFPLTAGFAYPDILDYGDKIAVQGITNGASFNGFYNYDPNTGSVDPLFNVSAGGICHQYIDLGASFK